MVASVGDSRVLGNHSGKTVRATAGHDDASPILARWRKSSEYGLGIEFPPSELKPPPEELLIAQPLVIPSDLITPGIHSSATEPRVFSRVIPVHPT